jgi:UDP-3-O-[3-hydroxymyristoyl] N-acetylglucosamine deacetylase/3-hydroxyacyl-[acyl-carrier-protein] dehydratase
MSEKQKTIKKPVSLSGKGLHTGQFVNLTIVPAPENNGYRFVRTDFSDRPEIKAVAENVVDTSRSTVIEENGVRVSTIEHVLSALYGLGIDNVNIEVDGAEAPILDGSAKLYVQAILEAGITEQDAEKEYFVIKNNINYSDEDRGIEISTFPGNELSIHVMIDYGSTVLGNQYATLNSLSEYAENIAPCKTFVFLKEIEHLYENNLIKGGDLDNALVIVEKESSQEEIDRIADLFNKKHQKYKGQGVLNEQDLIFSNEPARHKLLDMVGDIALAGMPLKGKILATRTGHAANVEFVKKIRAEIKKRKTQTLAPEYDPNKAPLYDINDIKNFLPHRPPFLLVDKIISLSETEVIGVKNVTVNEPFFVGHFPAEPVMPGVLIVEAMAQTGGILVLNTVEDPENYLTYFMKIDKIKFKKKVVPGDTLIFKLELISPIRRGIANMKAQAFVGDSLVTEGELMAQIVKENKK